MSYSGGVHVRIMWWIHSATLAIQREFTWECCDDSIVQHELLWKEFTWECYADYIFQNEPPRKSSRQHAVIIPLSNMSHSFRRSSRENVLMIPYSNIGYSRRVHVRMDWWFQIAKWLIQKEFT